MRRGATALGALAITGLMLAGCGSSDSSSDEKNETTTTTAAPATTTTAAPALTETQLQSMLLTATEMGPGWEVDTSADSGGGSSTPSCLKGVALGSNTDDPTAEIEFARTNQSAFAYEALTASSDPSGTFADAKEALDNCTNLTIGEGADAVAATIQPSSVPTVGDQSGSWTLSFTQDGQELYIEMVIATQGDVIIVSMAIQRNGPIAPDAMEQLAAGMAQKVAQQAPTA